MINSINETVMSELDVMNDEKETATSDKRQQNIKIMGEIIKILANNNFEISEAKALLLATCRQLEKQKVTLESVWSEFVLKSMDLSK